MKKFIQPSDVIRMIEDGSIIGTTITSFYKKGVNKVFPVTKEFLGIVTVGARKYLRYYLTNKNTKEYKTPKIFEYSVEGYIDSMKDHISGIDDTLDYIILGVPTPTWEV